MKVVVCTKQTPSTTAVFTVNNGTVSWDDPGGKPNVVNPWDEYAIEEGIRLKENHGASDVIALAVGSEESKEALKTALAMGCTEAILVSDDAFAGSDAVGSARVWAAAINHVSDAKVALFGKLTIDDNMGVAAMMTAQKLGWTPLTFVSAIKEISEDSITVERLLDDGKETVTAPLPAVLSLVKEINEPRYPSFMGIRKANRAEIPVWSAGDLTVEGETGAAASKVDWSHVYTIPPREGSVTLIEADSVEEQAKLLADKLFEEKVI
ncbi:MAG: electron transfer flavoprotein subunit beta/FixA family protein [Ardenticatenaceae bacterium]|nr:electron transfer flavoprotein subunit beta/FixA family protein [Anaerolineales bacterium]MCB8923234.1 electron transfer flavoprotein subunit beta/FixA family protein [Ardenticatenaceae bacterium]MCB9004821.1 electron transfer flavoprotein subunit beta/FixA family protein [Ardenticatenaceae bacterium]